MAIGELDVQMLTGMNVRSAPQHLPFGVAGDGEAAGKHVVIAERIEEPRAGIETLARPRHQRGQRAPA